jgi:Flp pilus assembly protein TadG
MGLVILLFTALTIGIIDFGRMLMVLNVITHAARDGARIAALTHNDLWSSGGSLSGAQLAALQARVRGQIATVVPQSEANAFNVTPFKRAGGAAGAEAEVTVSGSIPFLFAFPGAWGGTIPVTRVATYRFEG